MVHGLGHRLQEYLPRTIHSEGLLIRWLTLNYESVSEMSVRELADAAGVSPSTIVGSVIRLAAGVIQTSGRVFSSKLSPRREALLLRFQALKKEIVLRPFSKRLLIGTYLHSRSLSDC